MVRRDTVILWAQQVIYGRWCPEIPDIRARELPLLADRAHLGRRGADTASDIIRITIPCGPLRTAALGQREQKRRSHLG